MPYVCENAVHINSAFIFIFWIAIKSSVVFSYTILRSHQHGSGFNFLYILDNSYYFLLLIIVAILMDVKWFLIVVSIYISLMITDSQHFYILNVQLHIVFKEMFIQVLANFWKKLFLLNVEYFL